uniref:Band 7 domain-containing protein n=1 Tax=Cyclophora tenuis TaxID=216820 RepID=A0A7S1GHP5_CYCTE
MCIPCFFTISTSEVGVVERCGKFSRLVQPGLSCVVCPFEQLVGRLTFRVQELQVRVETKTLDNVFLTAAVTIQYQVLREKVYEAFYALTNPTQQITAHVYDVMRAQLPTLELDAVFEAKEELALAVKNALSGTMSGYGYQILQTLITDLDPDTRVKNAMNEINSSKRLKFAIAERAEGDKILQVKSAEAEAEAKYLSGVGVAKQRKAIVDGLRTSIVDFADGVKGSTTKDVMDLLLLTQYFDMVRDVGSANHCRTTFVPSSRGLGDDFRNSILQADSAKFV